MCKHPRARSINVTLCWALPTFVQPLDRRTTSCSKPAIALIMLAKLGLFVVFLVILNLHFFSK